MKFLNKVSGLKLNFKSGKWQSSIIVVAINKNDYGWISSGNKSPSVEKPDLPAMKQILYDTGHMTGTRWLLHRALKFKDSHDPSRGGSP